MNKIIVYLISCLFAFAVSVMGFHQVNINKFEKCDRCPVSNEDIDYDLQDEQNIDFTEETINEPILVNS